MKNNSRGFSLIEMLIVIAMFAVLAFIVTQSTLQSFRGTRKVDAASKVRDSLSVAASIVERNVRNAKRITSVCDGASHSSISFIKQDGTAGNYVCSGGSNQYVSDGTNNTRITANDISLSVCSFTCSSNGNYNPPIIDYVFAGSAIGTGSADASFATISRRVILRVY